MKLAYILSEHSVTIRRSFTHVVHTTAVLGIGNHWVSSVTSILKVESLEVSGGFVEAKSVSEIMVHVGGVEQLSDDEIDIFLGSEAIRLAVVVHKGEGLVDRAVVQQIVALTFPIFMGDDVVADGGEACGHVARSVHTWNV